MPNLYVVNVKHGNSAVLVDRTGIIVFDAGRRTELLEFLCTKKITQIDILLLSHADADHIGGAMALINSQKFKIKKVYINSDIKETKIFDDLVWTLYNNPSIKLEPSITPNLNGSLDLGDVSIEVLAPSTYLAVKAAGGKDRKGRTIASNTISAVIKLKYNNDNIALLPGDIDTIGLDNLLEDNKDVEARILIFPHHGGSPGGIKIIEFADKICEITKAELIIFSIDDNDKEYPKLEVIDCITNKFKNAIMLTTGSSNILKNYIIINPKCKHKNGVGHIEIDLDTAPLDYKTFGNR
jgi:competence protein ComEC